MVTNCHEIIDYWFSDKSKKYWFSSTPDVDKEIKTLFEDVWLKASKGDYNNWQSSPEGALALIIVLDQFPLNMFRGEPKSFDTESMALDVVIAAINNGYDKKLTGESTVRTIASNPASRARLTVTNAASASCHT